MLARRCRPTLRLLTDDLRLPIPPPEVTLDNLAHPVLKKAHGYAPSHPQNQIRIESITDTMVYRFTHGRSRVATWLETPSDIVWVCAEDIRRDGASDDVYEYIERLHAQGALLPVKEDATRIRLENVFRFQNDLAREAPSALNAAERQAGEPLRFTLTPLQVQCELLVVSEEELEEVWLSVSSITGLGKHLQEKTRQFIFAVFKQTARSAQWEERGDWPTRPLEWYEVALLGVRERSD
jgi:hypothetical protein